VNFFFTFLLMILFQERPIYTEQSSMRFLRKVYLVKSDFECCLHSWKIIIITIIIITIIIIIIIISIIIFLTIIILTNLSADETDGREWMGEVEISCVGTHFGRDKIYAKLEMLKLFNFNQFEC